jgi:hypothetical protein
MAPSPEAADHDDVHDQASPVAYLDEDGRRSWSFGGNGKHMPVALLPGGGERSSLPPPSADLAAA